jgi:hypothetical protein
MNYKTKTPLILPFKKTLFVSNGGRSLKTNSHMQFKNSDGPQNQLYAYDFRTETQGKEKKLKELPVFGIEVISPGDGIIAQIINGAFDLSPGERNRGVGVGNAITIDHQNNEFSFLCHLKHNSIKVKVGQKVKQGQILARCGNSGNTFQPHIHYHLQDSLFMHKAKALPAQFKKIKVNGKVKENYEPIRGDIVINYTSLFT